jgi:hypothetical protein
MFRLGLILALFSFMTVGESTAQPSQQSTNSAVPVTAASVAGNLHLDHNSLDDLTNLTADRNRLKPLVDGVLFGKDEEPGYTREFLRLEWRPSDPIDIWLIKPRSVAKPRVVLYLYGYPSDVDRFQDRDWDERATSTGLAAVGFVSALTGERYRGRPMRQWFISELQESLVTSTHDVQLILDYLQSRGDLNMDKVGMFGQGSGATIAILTASVDKRIFALDLLNPWGDWPDWLRYSAWIPEDERPDYITPEFLKKVVVADPVNYLPKLKDRALRLQQVMDDTETPAQARDKIAASTPPEDLVQYPNRDAHRTVWMKTGLTGWMAENLGAESAPLAMGSTK